MTNRASGLRRMEWSDIKLQLYFSSGLLSHVTEKSWHIIRV